MNDPVPTSLQAPIARFEPLSFDVISGWREDDHAAAFAAFLIERAGDAGESAENARVRRVGRRARSDRCAGIGERNPHP